MPNKERSIQANVIKVYEKQANLSISKQILPGNCPSFDSILQLHCMLGLHYSKIHKFEDETIKASWQDGMSGFISRTNKTNAQKEV